MKEILPSLPVQYRQADLPDAGMLGYIYYESWMSTVKGLLPERYLEPYTPEALADAMYRLIGTTYADYFLIDVDGEPSGFCAADYQADPEVGEITHLFLLPAYTGKGYGEGALRFLLDHLKGRGKSRAAVWVNASNERAVRFYERQGFLPTGEERALYMGVPQTERRYERTI